MMIVDFELEHIHLIKVQPSQQIIIDTWAHDLLGYATYLKNCGDTFTVFNKGEVIGIGGIERKWQGVGIAWCLFSDCLDKHKYFVYKQLKKGIERYLGTQFHRIETYCEIDKPSQILLLEKLGFKREGLLRRYGLDGNDFYMYSLIAEEK